MKRVITLIVTVLLCSANLLSQLNSVSGSVLYSQQYADNLSGNQLLIWQTRSPAVDLEANGVILSRAIAEFDLQTYISDNHLSSRGLSLPLDFDTQNWTLYRINLSLIQFSPCLILYDARDGYLRTHTTVGSQDGLVGKSRSQSQDLSVSLRRISFLPLITLSYNHAHTWAVEGAPSDNMTQSYSISSGVSGGGASFNISAQSTETHDLLNDSRLKFSTVEADASKYFSEAHTVNVQSRYSWYDQVGFLYQDLAYTGRFSDQILVGSSVSLTQTLTPVVSTTAYSAGTNLSHTLSPNWSYGLNLGGFFNVQSAATSGPSPRTTVGSWSSGFNLTHQEKYSIGSISNQLSGGGNWSNDYLSTNSYQIGLSNSYANTFGATDFRFSQRYALILINQVNGQQFRPANYITLNAATRISPELRNQLSCMYSDNRSFGDLSSVFFARSITANEGIQGNFNYCIPFSVTGGFSIIRYIGDITGTAYGWNASFYSGRFFTDNLTLRYRFDRTYDVLYHVEWIDNALQFHYGWRMLSMGLTLHQRSSSTRQRDVTFTISRPF